MRKLFIGTMLTSLLGAAVIGGALAWTGSTPAASVTASSGAVAVVISGYNPTGNLVVPTATDIKVADAGITNNGDITVHVTGGSVTVTNLGVCGITGSVGNINGGNVAPATSFAPLYDVFLNMPTGAPNGCQGQTINYDLTINVAT